REIRPLLDTVDVLFDIHSMQKSAEPLLLCGMAEQGRGLAGAIGMPRLVVADAGHAAGRRMRDYGGFGREDSGKAALLIECGQHWAKSSETVAIQSAVRLLHASGCVPDTFGPGVLGDPVEQVFAEVTEVVTIRGESFSFVEEWTGGEIIPEAGTLLGYDDGEAIRTPYDNCMLVMPTMRTYHGQTAVRLARVYDQGWSGATPSRKLMIAL
ncbi:MAG: succinylglutamate desuccinylase, partial [Pseudomonadota bacterium]